MKVKYKGKILKRIKQLKKLKSSRVEVGFPKGWNAYPDGTPVALVAITQEFGSTSRNIPPRPFFRNALMLNMNYRKDRKYYFSLVAKGKMPTHTALAQLGDKVAQDIQESIVMLSRPALKEATVKKKGSSNPLVDTGHLKQSVTYKVER